MKNTLTPIFKDNQKRDVMIICPGGGYSFCSPREAMPVADVFLEVGFHCAIMNYRNELNRYPEVVHEGLAQIEEFAQHPLVGKLFIIGFSAGGHYALLLASTKKSWFSGIIACYPVVSSELDIRHVGSINNLLGANYDLYVDEVSIEKRDLTNMCPLFCWHTMDDQVVKVENTILLVQAIHQVGGQVECHLFPKGVHGLSLANRHTPFDNVDPLVYEKTYSSIAIWVDVVKSWLNEIRKDYETS
jgi:acetyl esterase/lipase